MRASVLRCVQHQVEIVGGRIISFNRNSNRNLSIDVCAKNGAESASDNDCFLHKISLCIEEFVFCYIEDGVTVFADNVSFLSFDVLARYMFSALIAYERPDKITSAAWANRELFTAAFSFLKRLANQCVTISAIVIQFLYSTFKLK